MTQAVTPGTSTIAQTSDKASSCLDEHIEEDNNLRRQHTSRVQMPSYEPGITGLENSDRALNNAAAKSGYDSDASDSILSYAPRRTARKRQLSQDTLLETGAGPNTSPVYPMSVSMDGPASRRKIDRGTETTFLGPGRQPRILDSSTTEQLLTPSTLAGVANDVSSLAASTPPTKKIVTLKLCNSKPLPSHLTSKSQFETTYVLPRHASESRTPHEEANEPGTSNPDNPVITHLLIKKSKKGAKITILKNVAGKALERDFVCGKISQETSNNHYQRINFRLTWSEDFVVDFQVNREEEADFTQNANALY